MAVQLYYNYIPAAAGALSAADYPLSLRPQARGVLLQRVRLRELLDAGANEAGDQGQHDAAPRAGQQRRQRGPECPPAAEVVQQSLRHPPAAPQQWICQVLGHCMVPVQSVWV